MFQQDKWPFIPVCLSEIRNAETLQVDLSGVSESLGRPLTLLDYDPQTGTYCSRIESIHETQHYVEFCNLLRRRERGYGMDDTCREWDVGQAKISINRFHETGNLQRSFPCHMGLLDMTYVIRIHGRAVAVAFSGQYRTSKSIPQIEKRILALAPTLDASAVTKRPSLDQLIELARELPLVPAEASAQLATAAGHIEQIVETEYERGKHQWEQAFLDRLRISISPTPVANLNQLRDKLTGLLEQIVAFCRCQYALFFGSTQEGDTVLAPLASTGLHARVAINLPHFNWKKASLPMESFDIRTWDLAGWYQEVGGYGIRGENSDRFTDLGCVVPVAIGDRYRGALALGPFEDEVDLEQEQRFLEEIANIVGYFALTALEVLYLGRERQRWRTTAMLLAHQLRTGLTPITTQIGRAKSLCSDRISPSNVDRVKEFLSAAEDQSIQLAQGAQKTLDSHVLEVEPGDFRFERYPLSALVQNCASGFADEARTKGCTLVIDPSVELLPQATVDVARLTIALGNLIDNAIKYCQPNTKITIGSHTEFIDMTSRSALMDAVIEVCDTGIPVLNREREQIFKQGTRGATAARMKQIPGSGLGLWEARAVIEAHNGKINIQSEPTRAARGQEWVHKVVVSVHIPIRG